MVVVMLGGKGLTKELYCAAGRQGAGFIGCGCQPVAVRVLDITGMERYTHLAVLHYHEMTTIGFLEPSLDSSILQVIRRYGVNTR